MGIQKIKSGRVSSVPLDVFVGNAGTIFYDEIVGDLRLSDGETPGGVPLVTGRATVTSATTPPTNGDLGEMFWDPSDKRLYIYNNDTWETAVLRGDGSATIASTTDLGVVRIGTGIDIDTISGTISVPMKPSVEIVSTDLLLIVNNKCLLPSMPVGDFVWNIALVYNADETICEHNNISLYIDNGIPFLVFNDSVFTGGERAVVSYAVAI